jgi:aminoglycoside phosphotransferase
MDPGVQRRALEAVRAVATTNGLDFEQASVVSSGSNVLVHLRPAPVVARVMTGTVVLHEDSERWLKREVSVLEFLAPSGLAVAPSPVIAPGPYEHDGLWMTFVEWIEDVQKGRPPADAARVGKTLRTLHDELRAFDGELGTLSELRDDIERLHGLLSPGEVADADRLASLLARLDDAWDVLLELVLPAQALHGDASLGNVLHTPDRLIWNDFEDVFRGPVHWDIAGYVMSLKTRGADQAFVSEVLDHYGWYDERELAPFIAAHNVYDEIWQLYDQQRRAAVPPAQATR